MTPERLAEIAEWSKCLPEEVERCGYAESGTACGFDGDTYDKSYDECHHPLDLAWANDVVKARGVVDELLDEVKRLREQVQGHVERIAKQSDLLSNRAERTGTPLADSHLPE